MEVVDVMFQYLFRRFRSLAFSFQATLQFPKRGDGGWSVYSDIPLPFRNVQVYLDVQMELQLPHPYSGNHPLAETVLGRPDTDFGL